ncbi:MAG TPA: hypothetical protein VF178_14815 [Gemmatimonadaceae bacterium]
MAVQNAADLLPNRTMETVYHEALLEHLFKRPYAVLVRDTLAQGGAELDLLQMSHRILLDLARLARGEISSIHIPNRLPRAGEYRDLVAV